MDESIRNILVLGATSLLMLVAVYRFISQRKQLSSGRILGTFLPQQQNGKFIFENRIAVSTRARWCRVLLTLKSAEANSIHYPSKSFFEKVAFLVGTPYTLILKDPKDRVVHTEARTLEPFVAWLGSHQSGGETLLGEHSTGSHEGTVTLLEFLPQEAGQYTLSLHITQKVEAAYPGSSSMWEVLEAKLTVLEDVVPLSKTVSYPHQRVRM